MKEQWDHRADLAEQAVLDRHLTKLWGIPGTALGVIAWPPTPRDKVFLRWHYWWQAHLLDNLIDAAQRRPTKLRSSTMKHLLRGIRMRNIRQLATNSYYDDKAWLALATHRLAALDAPGAPTRRAQAVSHALTTNIVAGVDPLTNVLPWRSGDTFYNVPTNGPAAILAARTGNLELAERLVDWTFDNLINEDGLVMDGLRMKMHGPSVVPTIHPYCQGVMLGACVELAKAQRARAGVAPDAVSEVGLRHITRAERLVQAIEDGRTSQDGVLNFRTSGGDGGLFNGILARYLSLVATDLPNSGPQTEQVRKQARHAVLTTAESAWHYRLEINGLPVFGANWMCDATMPQSGGLVGATLAGAVGSSDIAERDMSVQLSGWMLMEAAARL